MFKNCIIQSEYKPYKNADTAKIPNGTSIFQLGSLTFSLAVLKSKLLPGIMNTLKIEKIYNTVSTADIKIVIIPKYPSKGEFAKAVPNCHLLIKPAEGGKPHNANPEIKSAAVVLGIP